jgi:hypothetical protein
MPGMTDICLVKAKPGAWLFAFYAGNPQPETALK